jgi:hypothetical protein
MEDLLDEYSITFILEDSCLYVYAKAPFVLYANRFRFAKYPRLCYMQLTSNKAMLLYCLYKCGPDRLDQWQT